MPYRIWYQLHVMHHSPSPTFFVGPLQHVFNLFIVSPLIGWLGHQKNTPKVHEHLRTSWTSTQPKICGGHGVCHLKNSNDWIQSSHLSSPSPPLATSMVVPLVPLLPRLGAGVQSANDPEVLRNWQSLQKKIIHTCWKKSYWSTDQQDRDRNLLSATVGC